MPIRPPVRRRPRRGTSRPCCRAPATARAGRRPPCPAGANRAAAARSRNRPWLLIGAGGGVTQEHLGAWAEPGGPPRAEPLGILSIDLPQSRTIFQTALLG